MEELDSFLAHYGVKGMRWGVRKDRSGGRPSGTESKKRKTGGRIEIGKATISRNGGPDQPINARGKKYKRGEDGKLTVTTDGQDYIPSIRPFKQRRTDALTNAELKKTVERMQLEKQYSELSKIDQSRWQSIKGRVVKSMSEYAFNEAMGVVNRTVLGSGFALVKDAIGTPGGKTIKPTPKKEKGDDSPKKEKKSPDSGQNGKKSQDSDPRIALRREFFSRPGGVWDRSIVDVGPIDRSVLGDLMTKREVRDARYRPSPAQTRSRYRRKQR